MNALRRIHAVLVPGGVVVDTQPVSARPLVEADGRELGRLDMREWRKTIDAVAELTARTIDDELFALETERFFSVADISDNGPALVDTVSGWRGTRLPVGLARRIAAAPPPISVHQEVRLRVLRALAE